MQRDTTLIREVLKVLAIDPTMSTKKPDQSTQTHLALLLQAKLINGKTFTSSSGVTVFPDGLTWEGQEVLAAIEDDEVWSILVERLGEQAMGAMPIAVLVELCSDMKYKLAQAKLGIEQCK